MVVTFARLRRATKKGGMRSPGQMVGDLVPTNGACKKSWCPWIWNQATRSLGAHGFGTKQTNSLGVHRFGAELPKSLGVHGFGAEQPKDLVSIDLAPSIFFSNVIESAEL